MKIINLTIDGPKPITVRRVKGKDYFNAFHGSLGKGLYRYSMGVKKTITEDTDEDTFVLDKDTYSIVPISKNGKPVHNSMGDRAFFITDDPGNIYEEDQLVFLRIPMLGMSNVKYKISGNAAIIGNGILGKIRHDGTISVPAPVLEVTGICEVTWTGERKNELVSQTYRFRNNKWTLSEPIIGTVEFTEIKK